MNSNQGISLVIDNGVKVKKNYIICPLLNYSSTQIWNWIILCVEVGEFVFAQQEFYLVYAPPDVSITLLKL